MRLRTSGFFASKTIGVDMTPLEAMDNYGMRDDRLRSRFGSTESLLAEMRTIRCIEHRGRIKLITPFVGEQVEICNAFGFEIPSGSAPAYTSKAKSKTPKRGRPAAPKTESQEKFSYFFQEKFRISNYFHVKSICVSEIICIFALY